MVFLSIDSALQGFCLVISKYCTISIPWQGGVTPIDTVLRSVTAVKMKGQLTRLILSEGHDQAVFLACK